MSNHSFISILPFLLFLLEWAGAWTSNLAYDGSTQGPVFIYEPPRKARFSNDTGGQLTCSAHGSPTPSISWVDSRGQVVTTIAHKRIVLKNGTLYFPPFGVEDFEPSIHRSTYHCVATNSAGRVLSRKSMVDAVLSLPYNVQVYNVFVLRGNVAVLRCSVSEPMRSRVNVVAWWKEDTLSSTSPVEVHSGGRYLLTSLGDLHIRDVSSADGHMKYKCQIRDIVTGRTQYSSSGHVIVTEPQGDVLKQPEIPDSMFIVQQGEALDLPCVAQGFPVPSFLWMKVNPESGREEVLTATPTLFPRHSVLSLVGARNHNAGRYICQIENRSGRYKVEHIVEVVSPLHVSMSPQHLVVDHGQTALFNCSVSGFPIANLIWLKGGDPLDTSSNPRIKSSGNSLYISNVSRKDRDSYQCVASNENDVAQGTAELVLGAVPPEFHSIFNEQTLRPGPKVSLKCVASGNPPPEISWFLDDEHLSVAVNQRKDSSYRHLRDRLVIGQYLSPSGLVISHLNISDVQSEDGGYYKCRAQNAVGFIEHQSSLNIYGIPRSRTPRNKTAVSGGDVLLLCPVSGYPIERIVWSKEGRELRGPRPTPLSNGTLLIQKVEASDATTYICVVQNRVGQRAQGKIHLLAIKAPKIAPFHFAPDLKEDDRAQVVCSITSGDLPIQISWEKDGKVLEPDSNIQIQNNVFGSSLLFFRLKAQHSGFYKCIASNAAETTNFTSQLVVKVPPSWLLAPKDIVTRHRSQVVLDCQASGNPRPTVSWRRAHSSSYSGNHISRDKDGSYYEYVQTSEPGRSFHPNGSLILHHVTPEDEGQYRCEVQNGVGAISKSVFVTVQVPVYFGTGSQNRTAVAGKDASLVCNALGNSPINLEWKTGLREKIGARMTSRYSIVEANSSGGVLSTLTIRSVRRSDSGEFICEAGNDFGTSSISIFLSVVESPEPPSSVHITELSSRSINLAWYPAYDGNSPVLQYIVQYKEGGVHWRYHHNKTVGGGESTGIKLGGLRPYTEYNMRVMSVNEVGAGDPSEVITAVTLQEAPAGPPQLVHAEPIADDRIRVTWRPPEASLANGRILGYYVRYGATDESLDEIRHQQHTNPNNGLISSSSPNLARMTVRGGRTQALVGDLRPFTKYQVYVVAFNEKGLSPHSTKTIVSTLEGVPSGPPLKVRCEAESSTSLSIAWRQPEVAHRNGIILGYKISYRLTNVVGQDAGKSDLIRTKKTSDDRISIHQLNKFSSYYVKVRAYTAVGDGYSSEKIICKTGADVPGAPMDIRALAVDESSILITWSPPLNSNGDITSYAIYIQNKKDIKTISVSGSEIAFTFRGLMERNHYEFWVSGKNRAGEGEKSHISSQSPAVKVPARIASFPSIIYKALHSSVKLNCLSVGNPLPQLVWINQGRVIKPSDQYELFSDGSLRISRIEEFMGNFSCQINNLYGQNKIDYEIRTIRPPDPPLMSIKKISNHAVELEWKRPNGGGASIQGYVLNYKKGFGEWEQRDLDYDDLHASLSHLACGSSYSFSIRASNMVGTGLPSSPITTSTKGSIPDIAPMNVLFTPNSTFITLHLYRWPTGGCDILYYVVEYKELEKDMSSSWRVVSNNLRPETEDLLVSDLKPATWYNLKLTAHNDAGSRVLTFKFPTLTMNGEVLSTEMIQESTPNSGNGFDQLVLPITFGIILTLLIIVGVVCYARWKRPRFIHRRYAGYTQGHSEYSVKSLSELEQQQLQQQQQQHQHQQQLNNATVQRRRIPIQSHYTPLAVMRNVDHRNISNNSNTNGGETQKNNEDVAPPPPPPPFDMCPYQYPPLQQHQMTATLKKASAKCKIPTASVTSSTVKGMQPPLGGSFGFHTFGRKDLAAIRALQNIESRQNRSLIENELFNRGKTINILNNGLSDQLNLEISCITNNRPPVNGGMGFESVNSPPNGRAYHLPPRATQTLNRNSRLNFVIDNIPVQPSRVPPPLTINSGLGTSVNAVPNISSNNNNNNNANLHGTMEESGEEGNSGFSDFAKRRCSTEGDSAEDARGYETEDDSSSPEIRLSNPDLNENEVNFASIKRKKKRHSVNLVGNKKNLD
ncbi:cell adhesion molecule Dscam1 isoform X3 [Lepeophtheirus salmonis]|uniref:cell adhesion molecule Dscam1 isoform X3 n=1 Tax=Lepeophtheirus salmonis TaxID=72036 RepID=UPI001AE5C4FC|nr:Down syndrome cell adhesion molecule-like protein Dscam2 isoform X2 [Lepeophtheirus salmonis]